MFRRRVLLAAALTVFTLHALADGALAAIGFVQGGYATPQSPQLVVAVTYASAQTSGNLNVVVVGWNDATAVVSSVTDSMGSIYTRAVGPTAYSSLTQSIYYAKNIVGAAANANTVTVRFNVAAVNPDIRILEYRGLDLANPIDVTAAATGTNTLSNSGATTTTNANDLIFGANTVAHTTVGAGTGFTSRMITQDKDIAEDRVVSAVGSYSASAPINITGAWVMQMVAFKAASGGTGDTTPPTAPSNLLATAAGTGGIHLAWTASSDNVGVTDYLIERCQGSGCSSFAQVATSSTTTFSDTGLLSNTSYSYQVRATDAAGNLSGYSNVSTATTNQSSASPIAFVQVAYADPQSPQLTVSVPFASAQTSGHLNVVVVGWNDTTAAVSSVTDSTGNVYTLAVGPTKNPGSAGTFSLTQSIYYAKNIVGAAGGANTVTVRFTVAAVYADIRILEYSGLGLANPSDVTAAAIGTSTASNSGAAATTTNANDLIFGANMTVHTTVGAGAGFTSRIITVPDRDIAEDRVVSAIGSYSASAPINTTGPWVMQMVAFRGALTGPPPPPPSQVGQWSGPFTWPIVAVHAALLRTGRVLASDAQSAGRNARVWDPSTNSFSTVNVDDNIFCNGAAALPDGRLLVAGGHFTAHVGLNVSNLFDPVSQTWSNGPAMVYDRWYPTVTALADGRMLVTGGEIDCDGCEAVIPEVYSPATNSWTSLSGASLSVPYYPNMFVLPDGRVLNRARPRLPSRPGS
jgi:chitodextrinase